jgi:hypothetical protein
MTQSRFDHAYGRRGGRIVAWIPPPLPPIGAVVRPAPRSGMSPGIPRTVTEHLPSGRVRIAWPDGALIVDARLVREDDRL